MVAYSFNASFVEQVQSGAKCQTVRLPRKRHARPGEPVQLFTGMRTRACRKLVDPDPICAGVDDIEIRFADHTIASIEINGVPLGNAQMLEDFAIADGFGHRASLLLPHEPFPASYIFTRWWAQTHPGSVFHGVVVRWSSAQSEVAG